MSHANLRVFFGHQSVGDDVLDGVRQIGAGRVQLEDLHVGENGDPLSKLADFERAVAERHERIDAALLKLCYADFGVGTDVEAVFLAYQQALARLAAAYPRVVFVHVTVPLTVVQGGVKGWLKRQVGLGAWGELENVKRDTFNRKLRAAYATAPLFDLALVESTRADGSLEHFDAGGIAVPKLRAEFTDDGGHLNAPGRVAVARALLSLLGTIQPPNT